MVCASGCGSDNNLGAVKLCAAPFFGVRVHHLILFTGNEHFHIHVMVDQVFEPERFEEFRVRPAFGSVQEKGGRFRTGLKIIRNHSPNFVQN